jgi:hypothetical protein
MTEDYGDRLERHEEMIQALARVWTRQSEINERMDMHIEQMDRYIVEQRALNTELVSVHRDINTRLERIETILARMLPGSTNGREG